MTIKNRTSTCMAQGEKRFTATMRHAFTANEMRDTGTQANHLLSLFAYPVYSIPNVRLKRYRFAIKNILQFFFLNPN